MADQDQNQDRLTAAMAPLMPAIRKAFLKGVESVAKQKGEDERQLKSVVRVDVRESALNVRLPAPGWPEPSDDLVEPGAAPEKALRLCRELVLHPVDAEAESVTEAVESFGEETAKAYVRAVLAKLVTATKARQAAQAAGKGAAGSAGPLDVDALHTEAKALGLPCRVMAGAALYWPLKDLSDAFVEKVGVVSSWPDQRALVLSLTSKGPWVEELEPEFVLAWAPGADGSVTLEAARRLYVHNAAACHLYEP